MKDFLVTVVLPIYNVEKYLDRCMESVTNQTYKNLEIIMVDDGATDSCPQKCDEWASKDERVKVIHKKNAGLGMARNTGIENATGDYIVFFDSDDYIANDAIEKAVKSVEKYDSELVIFGFSFVDVSGRVFKSVIPQCKKKSFTGEEIVSVVLPDLLAQGEFGEDIKNLWVSAWVNMYSMNLINRIGWRFVSEREIISEDVYSLLDLYSKVETISIVEEALYYYCENAASLTRTYRSDRFEKINIFYDKCYQLICEKKYGDKVLQKLSYPYFANVIGALKLIMESDKKIKDKYLLVNNIVNNDKFQSIIKKLDLSHEKIKRKILIKAVKNKMTVLVMVLILLRNQK